MLTSYPKMRRRLLKNTYCSHLIKLTAIETIKIINRNYGGIATSIIASTVKLITRTPQRVTIHLLLTMWTTFKRKWHLLILPPPEPLSSTVPIPQNPTNCRHVSPQWTDTSEIFLLLDSMWISIAFRVGGNLYVECAWCGSVSKWIVLKSKGKVVLKAVAAAFRAGCLTSLPPGQFL